LNIRHVQAIEAAAIYALRTKGAFIKIVAHDESLVYFIQHKQFQCTGRAIFNAELASGAIFRVPDQFPAQVFRGSFLEKGISLRDRFLE